MTKSGIAEKFLRDVRECSNKILKNPDWQTTGAVSLSSIAQVELYNSFSYLRFKDHERVCNLATGVYLKPYVN